MRKERKFSQVLLSLCLLLLMPVVSVQTAWAQSSVDKKVTMNLHSVSITEFFDRMNQQTGLNFIYNSDNIKGLPNVSVNVKATPASTVIRRVLGSIGCEYRLEGNMVTVTKTAAHPSKREITGLVTDDSGNPLPGATVSLRGTKAVTVTDGDGRYRLDLPREGTLVYAFIGMSDELRESKGKNKINVTLKDNAKQIDEVVVTGLMDRDAKNFTGNASVYNGEELKMVGHQNLIKSLALLDPSISLTENVSKGSDPNTMPQIRFRGESSFQGFESIDKSGLVSDPNQPLFLFSSLGHPNFKTECSYRPNHIVYVVPHPFQVSSPLPAWSEHECS